jgi:4a-hydroxytetrahydrobiopterin dehydratase
VGEEAGGHQQLAKEFRFKDFLGAVDFVNRLTPVAEAAGHHPDLLVGWGRVRVQSWTHDAGGLTDKDYELARAIEALSGS